MHTIRRQAYAFMSWWQTEPEGHSVLVITLALGFFAIIVLVIKALVG